MAERLSIDPIEGLGIATVMARKGVGAAAIGDALGLALPERPGAAFAGARTAIGTGRGSWLVLEAGAAATFAEDLQVRLAGIASVMDQSSAYAITRLRGPDARTVLRRGAAIDVHPSVFGPGSAATTLIAHIGVILWQVDDQPTYDLAVFRSYADSFGAWLDSIVAAL